LYLALVIDLYKRRIVGWAVSDSPDSSLTLQALTMAYYSRSCPDGVMFHSDQGCHYTSEAYRKGLKKYGIKQSMSRRGNCWDNAPMERCFRSFKTEWMLKGGYQTIDQAKADIVSYISYYNFGRGHSYNDYLAPAVAEAGHIMCKVAT
jgi:putative transposase